MGARHRSLRHAYLPPQEVGFVTADFSKEHALEVIAVVAASTITNYTASMRKTACGRVFSALFMERLIIGHQREVTTNTR
jgi:hypothetical protein